MEEKRREDLYLIPKSVLREIARSKNPFSLGVSANLYYLCKEWNEKQWELAEQGKYYVMRWRKPALDELYGLRNIYEYLKQLDKKKRGEFEKELEKDKV